MQRLSSKAQGLTCSCCCLRGGSNESRRVVKRECRHPEIGGQTKSGQRKTSHSEREAYSQRADVHGDRRRRIVGECCEPKTTNFPTNLGTTDLVCYLFRGPLGSFRPVLCVSFLFHLTQWGST